MQPPYVIAWGISNIFLHPVFHAEYFHSGEWCLSDCDIVGSARFEGLGNHWPNSKLGSNCDISYADVLVEAFLCSLGGLWICKSCSTTRHTKQLSRRYVMPSKE